MFEELDVITPDEAFDGPMQMALDEVLLGRVRRPTLRFYQWKFPSVTFGYFQPHSLVSELYPGFPAVRRWTGGGAVVHGEDLTFSLMVPEGDPVSGMMPSRFYRELHGAVAKVCGGKLASEGQITPGPSCFSAPSRDDLMVGARKILGGAIRRSGGALLYQGSLLDYSEGVADGSHGISSALCKDTGSRTLDPDVIGRARVVAEARYATDPWNRRL